MKLPIVLIPPMHGLVVADNQIGVWFYVLVYRRGSSMFCIPSRCFPSALSFQPGSQSPPAETTVYRTPHASPFG